MEYIEHLDAQGLNPRKFIVGDKTIDGHEHIFYLRDDLPRATSVEPIANHVSYHAHSIYVDFEGNLICGLAKPGDHTHEIIREVPLDK